MPRRTSRDTSTVIQKHRYSLSCSNIVKSWFQRCWYFVGSVKQKLTDTDRAIQRYWYSLSFSNNMKSCFFCMLIFRGTCDKNAPSHRPGYSTVWVFLEFVATIWNHDFKTVDMSLDMWHNNSLTPTELFKSIDIPWVVVTFWNHNFKNVDISLDVCQKNSVTWLAANLGYEILKHLYSLLSPLEP